MSHYRQIKIMTSAEGAVGTTTADLEAHSFTLLGGDFMNGGLPHIVATGISTNTITLWERVDNTWVQVYKNDQAVNLDAANPQEALNSYGTYAVAGGGVGTAVYVTKAARY